MRTLDFNRGQQFVVTTDIAGRSQTQVVYEALRHIHMNSNETDSEFLARCLAEGSIKPVDTGDSHG